MPEKNPLMESTMDFTLFFSASIGDIFAFFIPFHTLVAVDLMPLKTEDTVLFTALKTLETLLFIPSTTPPIVDLMPFQTEEATDFIALNTVVTTVRSEERRVGKEC